MAIGVSLAMMAGSCMFVAMYYNNWKRDLRKAWKWLGIGMTMLLVALLITK